MKRLTIACALTLVLAVGSPGRANAQVVYGYGMNPYTGTVRSNFGMATPYAAQYSRSYYNPVWGYGGQSYSYQNAMGAAYARSYGVNPWTGPYSYYNYQTPVTIWGTTYPNWYLYR